MVQPTKEHNLRQCYQVIQYLFLWASRGVGGVSKGVTFIHRGLATVGAQPEDRMAEAYATIGVEPTVSMEEVTSVYHAMVKYAHPDGARTPEHKRIREQRTRALTWPMKPSRRPGSGGGTKWEIR